MKRSRSAAACQQVSDSQSSGGMAASPGEGLASPVSGANSGSGGGRERVERAGASKRATAGGRTSSLEPKRKFVEGEAEERKWLEVRACGCRCRFCPKCCVPQGLALRKRLLPVLETFTHIMMWTLTLDPGLFGSPAEAFEYVRSKRCVAEWVRSLRARGVLESDRYFCVVEWQKATQMPHFHVLLDARYIDKAEAEASWGRFRPADAGPVPAPEPGMRSRPEFGTVWFSETKFESPRHAANYACKYLTKTPEDGYPEWVLNSRGEIKRYSVSKGFWASVDEVSAAATETAEVATPDDGADAEGDQGEETPAVARLTIGERIARCGRSCVVLEVTERKEVGGAVQRRRFVYACGRSLAEALDLLGVGDKGVRSVELSWREVRLLKAADEGTSEGEAELAYEAWAAGACAGVQWVVWRADDESGRNEK